MPTLSAETGRYTKFKFPGSKMVRDHLFIFFDESPSLTEANQFIKKNNGKLVNQENGVAVYQEYIVIPFEWIKEIGNHNKIKMTSYGVYYRYVSKRRSKS